MAPNPDYMSYTQQSGAQGATEILAMAMAPRIRVNGIALSILFCQAANLNRVLRKRIQPIHLKGCTWTNYAAVLKLMLDCPAMTGEVIVLDGGQKLQRLPRDVAFLT